MKNVEDHLAPRGPLGRIKNAYLEWRFSRSLLGSFNPQKKQERQDDDGLSDYEKQKQRKQARLRIIVSWVSLVSFGGSVAFATIQPLLSGLNTKTQTTAQSSGIAQELQEKLKAEEQGYLLVLQREPNNLVALDGLAAARIKAQNWQGAIEPLEKLVALNPNQEDLKQLLQNVKRRAALQKRQATQP